MCLFVPQDSIHNACLENARYGRLSAPGCPSDDYEPVVEASLSSILGKINTNWLWTLLQLKMLRHREDTP